MTYCETCKSELIPLNPSYPERNLLCPKCHVYHVEKLGLIKKPEKTE